MTRLTQFNNTFRPDGLFDFRDEQGNLLNDVTVSSASVIDWLSPPLAVPLPGSW